jgi:hypothetical protein
VLGGREARSVADFEQDPGCGPDPNAAHRGQDLGERVGIEVLFDLGGDLPTLIEGVGQRAGEPGQDRVGCGGAGNDHGLFAEGSPGRIDGIVGAAGLGLLGSGRARPVARRPLGPPNVAISPGVPIGDTWGPRPARVRGGAGRAALGSDSAAGGFPARSTSKLNSLFNSASASSPASIRRSLCGITRAASAITSGRRRRSRPGGVGVHVRAASAITSGRRQ